MNIFVTDACPIQSAIDSSDTHCSGMPKGVAQQLSTALHQIFPEGCAPEGLYKPTHINHCCTVWVGQNRSNFQWAVDYGQSLCQVYNDRYKKTHASQEIIDRCSEYSNCLPEAPLSPFAEAITLSAIKTLRIPTTDRYRVFIAWKYLTKLKPRKDGAIRHLIDWQKEGIRPVWFDDALAIAQNLI